MGLIEKAATIEFVGQEFATWLYWHSDRNNGRMQLEGVEEFELWFEAPVQLVADFGEATAVTLKGGTPLESKEAHQAMREGKKIDRARLRVNYRNQTYTCGFNASTFMIGGLKIPMPQSASPADYLHMRLEVFEEFLGFFNSVFEAFLKIRLNEKAWASERNHIAKWVKTFDVG